MRTILCMLCILFSMDDVISKERDDSLKTKFGFLSGIQLSSTKWSIPVMAEIQLENNLCYLGAKIPISTNNLYGYFPLGVIGGYGYRLIQNEKWKAIVLLDVQWLGSKTQNQIKSVHFFDFTMNYRLTYKKWNKVQLNSSFGYGAFVKYFFRSDAEAWGKSVGVSGLICVSAGYSF